MIDFLAQVTRPTIKSRVGLKLDMIRPRTVELAVLECLDNSP